MSDEKTSGRLIGGLALATLIALVGYAFYSGSRGGPATPAAQAAGDPEAPAPAESGQAGAGQTSGEAAHLQGKGKVVTATAEIVMLSPAARMLAEKIQCVCGCKDILAACNCKETPGSQDMQRYLQQLVNQGKNPTEVMSLMEARYGPGIHPER